MRGWLPPSVVVRRAPGRAELLAALLAACGGDGVRADPAAVASVQLAPAPPALFVGSQFLLTAIPRNADGDSLAPGLTTWQSSAPTVATVSASGLVAAVGVGSTTVSATVAGRTGRLVVTVVHSTVSTIEFTPGTLALEAGRSWQVVTSVRDGSGATVYDWARTWVSSDTAVATVSGDGLITARRDGTALMTVRVADTTTTFGVTVASTRDNLRITTVALTQPTITAPGSIPLVAGRGTLVRVVATATPSVRVPVALEVRRGGVLEQSLRATPELPLPSAPQPNDVRTTANFRFAADFDWTGVTLRARVDPDGVVAESDEYDNYWPTSSQFVPDVVFLPPLTVHLVPVISAAGGTTGGIAVADESAFLALLRDVMPVRDVTLLRRSPFVFEGTVATNDGQLALLAQLDAARVAAGAAGHYFGAYHAGGFAYAGLGYRPGFTAVGLDGLPWAANTVAHEIGHNLNLQHAPCGTTTQVDPQYPYANAVIGVPGYDLRHDAVVASTAPDLMSYCFVNGNGQWISDYNYRKALAYRRGVVLSRAPERAGPGVLVWGRVGADRRIALEPVFALERAVPEPVDGAQALVEGFDAAGTRLFAQPVPLRELADAGEGFHFAAAVPLAPALRDRLARVTVSTVDAQASTLATPEAALREAPALRTERADGATRLRWNSGAARRVMLRDAVTGDVLGFPRGDGVALPPGVRAVALHFGDGLRDTVVHWTAP